MIRGAAWTRVCKGAGNIRSRTHTSASLARPLVPTRMHVGVTKGETCSRSSVSFLLAATTVLFTEGGRVLDQLGTHVRV